MRQNNHISEKICVTKPSTIKSLNDYKILHFLKNVPSHNLENKIIKYINIYEYTASS